MNQIARVFASSLKGLTFDTKLGKLNILLGKNFAGKTARLDAINIALTNRHPNPNIPKTNGGVFLFASGPEMTTGVEWANGEVVQRNFTRTAKGISAAVYLGQPGQGLMEVEEYSVPPASICAKAYLDLSIPDRMRLIFKSVPMGNAAKQMAAVHTKLEAITVDTTADIQEFRKETIQEFQVMDEARHREETPIQEWLGEMIASTKKTLSEKNASAKAAVGMVNTMVDLQAQQPQQAVSATTEADLARAREQANQLASQINSLNGDIKRAEAALARRNQLQADLATDEAPLLAELTEKQTALEEALKERPKSNVITDLQKAIGEVRQKLGSLSANITTERTLITDLTEKSEGLKAQTKCPFCKAAGKNWKTAANKEYRNGLEAAEVNLSSLLAKEKNEKANLKELTERMEQTQQEVFRFQEMDQQLAAIQNEIGEVKRRQTDKLAWRQELEGIQTTDTAAMRAEIQSKTTEYNTLRGRITQLEGDARRLVTQRAKDAQRQAAESNATRLEAEAKFMKKFVAILEEAQAGLVADAFGTLLDTANRVAGPILDAPLCYEDGELGRRKNGRFISTRTFTGAEEAITHAALSIALAIKAPIKLVMIDEMGRLEPQKRREVVELLENLLLDKVIDQAIVVDVDKAPYAGMDAYIIRL